MNLLLSIRDYLIVIFSANSSIPAASLEICDWVKSRYPLLNNKDVINLTASLIRSLKDIHEFYPLQQAELNKAAYRFIRDRYKK